MKKKSLTTIISMITILFIFSFVSHAQSAPNINSPTPGSTLSGETVTFTWSANGTSVTWWWLYVGSSRGAYDIRNSGSIAPNLLSYIISGLPTDGRQVYVRLWHYYAGSWNYVDAQYTSYTEAHPGTGFPKPSYDSGWISSENWQDYPNDILYHNLGVDPDNCVVDLTFRDEYVDGDGINNNLRNQRFPYDMLHNAYWYDLESNSIRVYNVPEDDLSFRIRIWMHQ